MPMYTLGHNFVPPPVHAGGLRYHGDAPLLCATVKAGLVEARAVRQNPTFEAALQFARTEGIIPAPESAHAIRVAIDEALAGREAGEERVILFNLSGHGHFDLAAYDAYLAGSLEDPEFDRSGVDAGPRAAARGHAGPDVGRGAARAGQGHRMPVVTAARSASASAARRDRGRPPAGGVHAAGSRRPGSQQRAGERPSLVDAVGVRLHRPGDEGEPAPRLAEDRVGRQGHPLLGQPGGEALHPSMDGMGSSLKRAGRRRAGARRGWDLRGGLEERVRRHARPACHGRVVVSRTDAAAHGRRATGPGNVRPDRPPRAGAG
jgi:hypothetical protein